MQVFYKKMGRYLSLAGALTSNCSTIPPKVPANLATMFALNWEPINKIQRYYPIIIHWQHWICYVYVIPFSGIK